MTSSKRGALIMLETIHIKHVMNAQLRKKVNMVSILPNSLKDCVEAIAKRLQLVVALRVKALTIHMKPYLIIRRKR